MSSDTIPHLVTKFKQKVATHLAIVIIRESLRKGISPVEYTKNIQYSFFANNEDKIDLAAIDKYLQFCQEDSVHILKQVVPLQPGATHPTSGYHDSEHCSSDWWSSSKDYKLTIKRRTSEDIVPLTRSRRMESVSRNAKFLESVIILSEQSEVNSSVPTSLLHLLMYDKSESPTERSAYCTTKHQLTEDSGVGYSEEYTLDKITAKCVSSEILKYTLHSPQTNTITTLSLKNIVNYFKKMLTTQCEEMFYEWSGSLNERIADIIKRSSRINPECKDIVVNFIVEVVGECWNDHRSFIHIYSEKKLLIVNELIDDLDVCYEILQNISEKLNIFNTYLTKKHVDVPILADKLCLFLKLYCTICETAKKLQSENGSSKIKRSSEECNVNEIWMKNHCPKDTVSGSQNLTQTIYDRDIEVLERLLVSLTSLYPLITMETIEALNAVRGLQSGEASSLCDTLW